MIPKFRIHGDGAELVPYTVPELFFFAGGRTLCFDAAREGDAIGHWHDEIELLYVTEGSMVYNVNGTRCTVHEGEGIFINTRQLHFFEESRCTYRCVLLRLQSLSYAVWDEIYRLAPKPENTVSESSRLSAVKNMMHAIHSGYAEKLTLEEIAGAGHVCKSACEKLFHTYLHCTPVEYLQRFRLQKAAERLCKTETPVAQIALDCGFSGASYFTGCFKKIYGCTPKAYRSSRKNTKA